MNLQSIRGTAAGIARQAGMELLRHYQQPIAINTKSTATDIVTEADTAADAIIRAALQAAFPDDHIVTEESGGQGAAADTAERVWYVDPLDGTSNFASGFPFFSVSIGLVDRNHEPLVGVIYDPIRNEMFSAARGFGATANGRPLHVSATDSLGRAMICSGFPYDYSTNPDNNYNLWDAFMRRARTVRCFGSAALELAYVAAGRLDAEWEAYLHPWDWTAGVLMVREAGGVVTDFYGGTEGMHNGKVISSNGHLHPALLDVIAEVRGR